MGCALLLYACPAYAIKYKVLHAFSGAPDGGGLYSSLAIDQQDNLYGTTCCGGTYGYGTVFELNPPVVLNELQNAAKIVTIENGLASTVGGLRNDALSDGRAIIKGTTDAAVARNLYARFVGS